LPQHAGIAHRTDHRELQRTQQPEVMKAALVFYWYDPSRLPVAA